MLPGTSPHSCVLPRKRAPSLAYGSNHMVIGYYGCFCSLWLYHYSGIGISGVQETRWVVARFALKAPASILAEERAVVRVRAPTPEAPWLPATHESTF